MLDGVFVGVCEFDGVLVGGSPDVGVTVGVTVGVGVEGTNGPHSSIVGQLTEIVSVNGWNGCVEVPFEDTSIDKNVFPKSL